jgi:16S rRNA (guanine527-N7)-methyltransferase
MNLEEFITELKKINIEVTDAQLKQLDLYYNLLIEWNKKINLTSIIEKKDVYLKHFYDSLTISKIYNFNNEIKLCDVGTGAGFPGIILKIFYPKLDIVLIDALNKRIKFLKIVINELSLNNIEAIHCRIEDYSSKNREKYDVVTARAVSVLNVLGEICLPLVKVNGYFIAMKGNIDIELNEANSSILKLGAEVIDVKKFNLPIENSNRSLVKIIKQKPTDKKYPRKFEIIKQKPL